MATTRRGGSGHGPRRTGAQGARSAARGRSGGSAGGRTRSTAGSSAGASRAQRSTSRAAAPRRRPTRSHRPGLRIPRARVGSPAVRHRLVLSCILVALLALSGRLVWVQGLDASARAEEAIKQRTVERTVPALRGEITDRDGTVLASSVERYDLWVNQLQVPDYKTSSAKDGEPTGVEAAAEELAPVLGWTVEETTEKLTGDRGFVYLDKSVDPAVRNAVLSLKIPGIGADRVAQRIYPAGSVAGNVLGFTGSDGNALAGAELSYDDLLAGTDGKTSYERGAGGQIIPTGKQSTTPATDGSDLVLTIDRDLQWKTQQLLSAAVSDNGATGGSAVVYNAKTGEVLALADAPTVDPNDPGATDAENRGNRSVSSVFDPGSTGKLFTVASALEEGTVDLDSQYHVPYRKSFDGHSIKDSHHHPDQQLTLAGVLKNSSNTGTVQIAETLDDQTRYDYLQSFGLGQATGVGLPGESAGLLRPADDWQGRTKYTTAFGQGYSVTALQMVAAIGTFMNDGVRIQPHVVAGTREDDGSITPIEQPEQHRVISSQTAAKMRQLMDNDVDDETAAAAIPGYAVGGKSGTAEAGDGTYTASFIGSAPMDDPEIVVGVYLFGLDSFVSGTTAASPTFSELLSFSLQNQGIAPTGVAPRTLENEW